MTKQLTTIKQLNRILKLHKKGLSLREIAILVDISHETARQIIKEYGIKLKVEK